MILKRPRQHDEKHLAFLRTLPCVVCINAISTEACHIRFSDARVAKTNPGSHKPHDFWCLPMCGRCHRDQHEAGDERAWWESKDIDPIFVAMALALHSGDHETGSQIVACATHKFEAAA